MSLPDLLRDARVPPDHGYGNTSINSLPLESLPCKPKPRNDVSSEDSGLAGGLRYSDRETGSRSGSFDDRSIPSFESCDSLSSLDEGEAAWDALGRMSSIRRSNRFDKPQLLTVEVCRGEKGFGVELEGARPPVLSSMCEYNSQLQSTTCTCRQKYTVLY